MIATAVTVLAALAASITEEEPLLWHWCGGSQQGIRERRGIAPIYRNDEWMPPHLSH
ncbi:MAG: hypothetical protein GY766_25550 [Herbaspirillum sp.]|nr:hypothetical protein [Herbaspirillum sp.]